MCVCPILSPHDVSNCFCKMRCPERISKLWCFLLKNHQLINWNQNMQNLRRLGPAGWTDKSQTGSYIQKLSDQFLIYIKPQPPHPNITLKIFWSHLQLILETVQLFKYLSSSAHAGPTQSGGLARGFMASGLAGTQPGWQVFRSSARPSHHYVWVASCLAQQQNRGIRDFRWAQRSGDANSHRGACLLWLIINYRVAWWQSLCVCGHFISQNTVRTTGRQGYLLFSGLAALW